MLQSFFVQRRVAREPGQGLVEYALILALVAVAVVGALTMVGGGVQKSYFRVNCGLSSGQFYSIPESFGARTLTVNGGSVTIQSGAECFAGSGSAAFDALGNRVYAVDVADRDSDGDTAELIEQ